MAWHISPTGLQGFSTYWSSAHCILMPSGFAGTEPTYSSGVTEGSKQLAFWESGDSLITNKWQEQPIVTGPEASMSQTILGEGISKTNGKLAFVVGALEAGEIRHPSTLPGVSEDSGVVGLLKAEELQVPVTAIMMHGGNKAPTKTL